MAESSTASIGNPTDSDETSADVVKENGIENIPVDSKKTEISVEPDVKPKTEDVSAIASSKKKKKKKKKKGAGDDNDDKDTVDGDVTKETMAINSNSVKDLHKAFQKMLNDDKMSHREEEEGKIKKYEFWETQPVPKLGR